MKKLLEQTLIALVLASTMSSCATIVAGGDPTITIDGDTKKPVTIITEKQTYPNVTLPCKVQVNRHHINGQRVQIKSEDADYRDVVLEKKINNWTFGNIILGGIFGWTIDLITNCVVEPSKPNYYIEKKAE